MCLVLISVAGIATLASELRSGSFDPNRGSIAIWIARIPDLKRYFVRPNLNPTTNQSTNMTREMERRKEEKENKKRRMKETKNK